MKVPGSAPQAGRAVVVLADSVTDLTSDPGQVVACGSHGGHYAASIAAEMLVAGIVFNDAGVGREGAGIAGLVLLDELGIAAAAVSAAEARIGFAADTARARLRHVNAVAAARGWRPGMAAEAALVQSPDPDAQRVRTPDVTQVSASSRHELWVGEARVVLVDSASEMRASDRTAVVVTGSHGGLVGGHARGAARHRPRVAVFNDAGGGLDGAGFSRLYALDDVKVAAVTVDAWSARIGDAQSALSTGVISHSNGLAQAAGAQEGLLLRDWIIGLEPSPKEHDQRHEADQIGEAR